MTKLAPERIEKLKIQLEAVRMVYLADNSLNVDEGSFFYFDKEDGEKVEDDLIFDFVNLVSILQEQDAEQFKSYLSTMDEERVKRLFRVVCYDLYYGNLEFAIIYSRLFSLLDWIEKKGYARGIRDHYGENVHTIYEGMKKDIYILHPKTLNKKIVQKPFSYTC